jgi:hypothetical protein
MLRKSAFPALFLIAAVFGSSAQAAPVSKPITRMAKSVVSFLNENEALIHGAHFIHKHPPRFMCQFWFFGSSRACKDNPPPH